MYAWDFNKKFWGFFEIKKLKFQTMMDQFVILEMILCAIACGIAWKMQTKRMKLVAGELLKVYREVVNCVNDYAVKGKTNTFSTNKSGNEHFREFGDKIMRELVILDIKTRIDNVCMSFENVVSAEGKIRLGERFEQLITKEFESYMELYIENELKHIEESLTCENIFNMTNKEVPENIVKWVANGPKFNPFVKKSVKKLIKEFDMTFCDSIVLLIRQHDKTMKATFCLEQGILHNITGFII